MLKILTKLDHLEKTYDEMLRGRAKVFHDRLKWNVRVRDGKEFDAYDEEGEPLYLVSLDGLGHVAGSLRVLSTTGPTMLKSEFGAMFQDAVDIDSPTAWECTRFCVHPSTDCDDMPSKNIGLQLLSGLCDLALRSGTEAIVGVYEAHMERIYRRLGWSPNLLSRSRPEFGRICCGLWDVTQDTADALRGRVVDCRMAPLDFPLRKAIVESQNNEMGELRRA